MIYIYIKKKSPLTLTVVIVLQAWFLWDLWQGGVCGVHACLLTAVTEEFWFSNSQPAIRWPQHGAVPGDQPLAGILQIPVCIDIFRGDHKINAMTLCLFEIFRIAVVIFYTSVELQPWKIKIKWISVYSSYQLNKCSRCSFLKNLATSLSIASG